MSWVLYLFGSGQWAASMPAHPNRLTVAHLLLWTATTGAALAYQLEQRPPPPEEIGFASLVVGAGQDPKIVRARAQQRIHRAWQTKYEIGLVFSPVYGAALAGAVLAIWRTVTGRFGFPTQPGHWLLLLVASLWLLIAAQPFYQSLFDSADGPHFALSVAMTVVVAVATIAVHEPLWRCVIGLWGIGWGILCLAYVISFYSTSNEPSGLFHLGSMAVAILPLAIAICTAVDLHKPNRYDLMHWIGIATVAGAILHILAIAAMARYD